MAEKKETESAIREYLRKAGKSMNALPRSKRNEALREIEGHIRQKMDDAKKEKPEMDESVVARSVITEMGTPEQAARAYAQEPAVSESALLRHIGKITAIIGLLILVFGLMTLSNKGFDMVSMPPKTDAGNLQLTSGESKTISVNVSDARFVRFLVVVERGTVKYELKTPSGTPYASGTASKEDGFYKTINNPENGIWSLTLTATLDDPENIFGSRCGYEILEVPIATVESAKTATNGAIFAIVGFFIIIAGGFAGLINTIKRRR